MIGDLLRVFRIIWLNSDVSGNITIQGVCDVTRGGHGPLNVTRIAWGQ
ncbi:hypothetical protein LV483_33165 [Pendulispora rubella]